MPRWMSRIVGVFLVSVLAGCGPKGAIIQDGDPPLYGGMGDHRRKVTTRSSEAQAYFDQGLVWAYAFNHDEAIRAFKAAAELDPSCAMAWWGIALCNGPHINNPIVPPDRSEAAWHAVQKAAALKDDVSPVERALIEALEKRYAAPPVPDRAPLDRAYAEAMRVVWKSHPSDSDVGTLCAEALMDLHPWDLWTQDGREQPWTPEILVILERVLEMDANNPGANHLYVHAIEASPNPGRANTAANRLRDLVPASGHLVHMPSHIDVLTGRWRLAAEQNDKAIEADRIYRQISPKQGFYRLYMAHNHHMLAFASMMEGRREAGLRAARDVVNGVPEDYLQDNAALMDPYMGAAFDVMKRFGMWKLILREPRPPAHLPITTAMWRFNRGLAHAALGDIVNAEQERTAFRSAVAAVPEGALMAINPAHKILQIADHMLNGEIAYRRGNMGDAVSELRQAIVIEDSLLYMEPPEWVQPVRHTLGAFLVDAGRFAEAERVYREDLKKWPGNGWSLHGLERSLRGQKKVSEADTVKAQFDEAWARADIEIESSCLCVKPVEGPMTNPQSRSWLNSHSIVFAIDRSGSMSDTFSLLQQELRRMIGGLDDDQLFTVIWFNEGKPDLWSRKLRRATQKNKRHVLERVDYIVPTGQTQSLAAVKLALSYSPEEMVLMSDGDFGDDNQQMLKLLRTGPHVGRTRIHTVGLAYEPNLSFDRMRQIAEAHNGRFVDTEAIQRRVRRDRRHEMICE